jgi:copper chaperone
MEESKMLEVLVPDMACGHCSNAVTEALKAIDATAQVQVDLEMKRVTVTTSADAAAVRAAIAGAGYTVS